MEARPIVLLAQLYRIWAAARAEDLLCWINFHKLSPLEDAQDNQAAEELGLLAAGMLEEAEATRSDGALLALDQSKAYDRVPLDPRRAHARLRGAPLHRRAYALHGQEQAEDQGP